MEEIIEVSSPDLDESLTQIFADPNFLLPNLLGAINVDVKEKSFWCEIPIFGKSTIVIYGRVLSSQNSVIYVIKVAGYGEDKGGKIAVNLSRGKIKISVDLNIPMERLSSRYLKSRINYFKTNISELIRVERIKRKI